MSVELLGCEQLHVSKHHVERAPEVMSHGGEIHHALSCGGHLLGLRDAGTRSYWEN